MKKVLVFTILFWLLAGCSVRPAAATLAAQPPASPHPQSQPGRLARVPAFDHIVLIVLENQDYKAILDSPDMPFLNALGKQNVLLTQYFAITHPSLPNYLAMIGGDTFGIDTDCYDCTLPNQSLADRLEAGGKTWRAYLDAMTRPCQFGKQGAYAQKHNPFLYFIPVRENKQRCATSVVPLAQFQIDSVAGQLPDFIYIDPDLCNSGHDCGQKQADDWLKGILAALEKAPQLKQNSLIIITFDESVGSQEACCGMRQGGGHVFTALVSDAAIQGFQDSTPYNHYSLLKTILKAWDLPDLGHTADPQVQPFLAPWIESR